MKRQVLSILIVMVTGGMLFSCSSDQADEIGEAKMAVNMLGEARPIMLTQEQRQFANDNNGFTLRFLKTVNETDVSGKSFIYSPLSITYVLGMVNDAATGHTERELEQTLGFHEGGIQAVNDYCKNLIDNLPKVDKKVTLNIANAIFVNKHYRLKEQFQKDMQDYYDAQAETLDFSSPETLGHINGWCDDKTNGMIPTILDGVDPDMASYLLNAIYFKADWASKFDPKNTKTESFNAEKGSIDLPMMHQNVLINYKENDTYTAIMMPYGDDYWNMTVMLPKEGKTTDDVINYLAGTVYYKTEGDPESGYYVPYEVDLKLPRFETLSDTEDLARKDTDVPQESGLITLLKKMGIQLAFDSFCEEICNMCELPVYISMMRQKAKIKVNEEGSEAAAVTVAGAREESLGSDVRPNPKATFHANRPFVYVIREASSGVILFIGKFMGE